jgi:hypothetical protein
MEENNKKKSGWMIFLLVVLMLGLVISWHVVVPALGAAIVVTGAVWGVMIASVVLTVIASFLFFILTGIGAVILGVFMLLGAFVVLALFPVLFPLIIPLVLLLFGLAYFLRKI